MIKNKPLAIFLAILAGAASIYLVVLTFSSIKAYNYIGISEEQRHSITVSGEGKATGAPDIAKIQLGYNAEKKTVAEAQKDNTEVMNKIIKKLKDDFKIDLKDIQTTNYNIYPQYDWDEGKRELLGYSVSQNLNVKIRDLDQVGKVLEAAGKAGLNQVGSLSFEIDEPEELRQIARVKALENAKEKAKDLAKVAGVKLGRIISFNISAGYDEPSPMARAYALEGVGMGGGAPSVEAGSSEIKVIATVEYEIL